MSILPAEIYGVKILKGIEANILDRGKLDLSKERFKNLDFVAAGLHFNTGHNLMNKEDYTNATIEAIKDPLVHMITHPANIYYPLVVKAASLYDVILELNTSSFHPFKKQSRGSVNLTTRLCKLAKQYGVRLSLNSDAHFHP